MISTPHSVRPATAGDHSGVIGLLEAADLPVAGLPRTLPDFFVAEHGGRLLGVVGLERYGTHALLRSAAVHSDARGSGVGSALVTRILQHAAQHGAVMVYLLTTTAEFYFHRFGFSRIVRSEVALPVLDSIEFRESCPDSAVVMHRPLPL